MRLIPGKTKVQIELFRGVTIWDVAVAALGLLMLILILISSLPAKFVFCCVIVFVITLLLLRIDTQPNYIMVLHMFRHLGYVRRYAKVYDDEMLKKKHEGDLADDFLAQNEDGYLYDQGDVFLEGDEEDTQEEDEDDAEQDEASDIETLEEDDINVESEDDFYDDGELMYHDSDEEVRSTQSEEEEDEEAEVDAEDEEEETQTLSYKELCRQDRELRKQEEKILKSRKATEEEKDAVWLARANRSAAKKKAKSLEKSGKVDDRSNSAFMDQIIAFTGIKEGYIEYAGKYYGAAIEVDPIEFRFFSQHRRDYSIESGLGRVLRSVHAGFAANIVKVERPIIYDKYLMRENKKMEFLRKSFESGMMSEDEFKGRIEIMQARIKELRDYCFNDKVLVPFYYVVLFESDKKQLELQVSSAVEALTAGELTVRRLNDKELAVFLKYTNMIDFDERDINKIDPEDYAQWAMPDTVQFKFRTVEVNHIITHNMRVVAYPSMVGDAWLAGVMSMPATKVVVKCEPMDRGRAIRTIDRSLQELRGQYSATGVDSKRIELENHIATLSELLTTLQGEGEELLECNIYITAYDIQQTRNTPTIVQPPESIRPVISAMKKNVRRSWQEANFRLNNMEFEQVQAFIGSQVSAYDPESRQGRGIPSNSIAAAFPWIYAHISDEGGFKMGVSDGVPVFIDFFRRDSERVNSNMVVIGKSGSGKSYATKSLLANLSAEDAKIFILDPENEYSELAHNLNGKVINVANSKFGRLNPFQIITALDDDEGGEATGSFATHLQFLEEFYRQILPEIDKDALEYLNTLTERLYTNKGISPETDLSKLRPEDYPIFDDLYDAVLAEFERTDNEYIRSMLRSLVNYVSKFSTGGRNSTIWNGPSTVTTDENFTVFNFQSMLSNRNSTIANAQMLLVLKYIDNEIIKNRDYNTRYKLNRKIVVVIDEAHVFIDTKYPIALDFMFQLAKRIRKYNGMQIVITQNIKDFVGSEEIARKSTAIINACQYSFIFSLAPNDITDLCTLYEKSGGINEREQEQITQAPRGQAFTIMSPTSRSTFKVEVPEDMVDMFQNMDYESKLFSGEKGAKRWDAFVGESRALNEENYQKNIHHEEVVFDEEENAARRKQRVIFEEIESQEEAPEIFRIGSRGGRKSNIDFEEEEVSFGGSGVSFEEEEVSFGAQPAPAPAPVPVQPQVVQSAEPQVNYEEMASQLRKQILAEVMEELKAGGIATATAAAGATTAVVASTASSKPVVEEEEEDIEEYDSDTALASLFNADFGDDESDESEESDDGESLFGTSDTGTASEGGYDAEEDEDDEPEDFESFDFSLLFSGDDDAIGDELSSDDDDEEMDIMELLRSDVEENPVSNEINNIDELVSEGEVADITLEELSALVKFLRKRPGA